MSRRSPLAALLLASAALCVAAPARAQVPEAPGREDPTEADAVTPPQSEGDVAEGETGVTEGGEQGEAAAGEEIVVTGNIPNELRDTSEIVSVIDSEDLARTGDADIGAALSRVTGLSLVDDRFVFVRGLGGRYSSVLLEGSVLPSPEPLRRVVPLDVFPSDLLSGALVQKTYSVEFPGEFAGGIIALRSRALPEEDFFELGVSGGYNTASTRERGFSFEGGRLDNLGFADESYELPLYVRTNPSLEGFDAGQLQLAGQALVGSGPGFSMRQRRNPADLSVSLSLGDRFDLFGLSAGFTIAASYDNQVRNRFGVRNRFAIASTGLVPFSSFSPEACEGFNANLDPASCGLRQTGQSISLGGVLGFGVEINEDNLIKLNSTLLRLTDKVAEVQRGQTPINDPTNAVSDQRLAFEEQELWFNQLAGEHEFGLGGFFDEGSFNWRGSYARASRVTPYLTDYRYVIGPRDANFTLSPLTARNAIEFTALEDDNYEGGADLTFEGEGPGIPIVIKLGGAYNKRERAFASRRYSFVIPPLGASPLLGFVPEVIFSPDNIRPGGLTLTQTSGPANSFQASTEIYGGYGALEAQVTDEVRLTAGVRYERSTQIVNGFVVSGTVQPSDRVTLGPITGFVQPLTARLEADNFLPAVTATWEFVPNVQLRAGYSRTLSRPDLRELSPSVIINIEEDVEEQGDPNLLITTIDNFDARLEWYVGRGQRVSLGGFYKKFKNPIERSISPFGDAGRRVFINADRAEVYGGELEAEVNLPFDRLFGGSFFDERRVFLLGNFTYAKSDVTIDPSRAGELTSLSRRLEGQSDILGNVQFGYEKEGERFAVLFNYTGDRISDVGSFGVPDVIEEPPIGLDVTFAKSFPIGSRGEEFELGFSARNLLNDDFKRTQGDQIYEQYDLGRTFSLGAKIRL